MAQSNSISFLSSIFLLMVILTAVSAGKKHSNNSCRHSGRIRGKVIRGGTCNKENFSECCKPGKSYITYDCSPPVTNLTKAVLTLNSFEANGDGGGPSECDSRFHSDDSPVVALSTGWFNHGKRCDKLIIIYGNNKSVRALVVDECDSTLGCDKDHDFQPPCHNNIVDGSKGVWKGLGVKEKDWGQLDIHWADDI